MRRRADQIGAASVEQLGLALLLTAVIAVAVASLAASPPHRSARELGSVLAERIACSPRHPVPCHRNPLALAYGFPVGKLVRYLAPDPQPLIGPAGVPQLPVDFRRCRRPSCAMPGPEPRLTASGRRVTAFTSVDDRRRAGGEVAVSYWFYRPVAGWERLVRMGGADEIAAAASLRLNLEDDPALVPLELLAGRNHYRFPRAEEPPWRWRIAAGEWVSG